ncbi:MAG: hypothetical protein ACK54X_22795 [Burkholderiales bacterium]|jgi:hypothetical protein
MTPLDLLVLAVAGLDAPQITRVADGLAHLSQLLDDDDAIAEAGRAVGALRSLADAVADEPLPD